MDSILPTVFGFWGGKRKKTEIVNHEGCGVKKKDLCSFCLKIAIVLVLGERYVGKN